MTNLVIFKKIRNYDFPSNHILIINFIVIQKVS